MFTCIKGIRSIILQQILLNFTTFSSTAGQGRVVGRCCGLVCFEQLQCKGVLSVISRAQLALAGIELRAWTVTSPTIRKWARIIPKSTHASLLRNNLPVLSVLWIISQVILLPPNWSLPVILTITAPRMEISWLSAEWICTLTGIRSLLNSFNFSMRLNPANNSDVL